MSIRIDIFDKDSEKEPRIKIFRAKTIRNWLIIQGIDMPILTGYFFPEN